MAKSAVTVVAGAVVFTVVLGCSSGNDADEQEGAVVSPPFQTTQEPSAPTAPGSETPPEATSPTPIRSGAWTHYQLGGSGDGRDVVQIDVNPDGTTWALLANDLDDGEIAYDVLRFGDDQWIGFDGLQLAEQRPWGLFTGPTHPLLAAGTDGTAWLLDRRELQAGGELVGDLWEFDGHAWRLIQPDTPAHPVIDAGGDGVLWAADLLAGDLLTLLSFDGHEWTESPHHPPGDASSFHVDARGLVWTRGSVGVGSLQSDGWTLHEYLWPAADEQGWFAPEDGYVVAQDGTMWAILWRGTSRADAELVTETFDGAAWRLWPAETSSEEWIEAAALAIEGWNPLAALGDEHLFVARENLLLWFDVAGTAEVIPVDNGAGAGRITALASDTEDTIWIGKDGILTRFDPAAFEPAP